MADVTIAGTSLTASTGAVLNTGIAGASITVGQPLYKDSTDSNKLKVADSNVSAAEAAVVGIAMAGGSTGDTITYITSGDVNLGATLGVGTSYYLSETAGGIQPQADLTTGEYVTFLGIGITAALLRVKICVSGITKA